MKVELVFQDWQRDGQSIYGTELGVELSLGDFHGGTVFDAEINLDADQKDDLRYAIENGAVPIFRLCVNEHTS